MRDVRLFHTQDGGELDIAGGRIRYDDTLETALYLSLFGGNARDDGTAATELQQWWGNVEEPRRDRHLRSATQHLLQALPATTANLPRIVDAVQRDIAWVKDRIDAKLDVRVGLPRVNRVQIIVSVAVAGEESTDYRFTAGFGEHLR